MYESFNRRAYKIVAMAKKGGEWGGGTSTGSLIDDHRPLMTKVTTPTQKALENRVFIMKYFYL